MTVLPVPIAAVSKAVDRKIKALKKAWNPFFKFIGQPITESKAEEEFKRKQTGFNF